MVRCLVLLSFSLAGLLAAGTAVAQPATPSRCADCHCARPDAPGQYHVLDWDRSPHGRNNVGCQACHGPGSAHVAESRIAETTGTRAGKEESVGPGAQEKRRRG